MSAEDWGIEGHGGNFWFNTRTSEVEEGPQTLAQYRIGPFETREEAERALEIVAERARKIREEDEADE